MVARLRQYYRHVDDVDLFVGGILERPLPGALMGPTFTCIIGDQFSRARKGDRFIYDHGPAPYSFSRRKMKTQYSFESWRYKLLSFLAEQLKQIRKASFARILCDNGDDIRSIQPFVFLSTDQLRLVIYCHYCGVMSLPNGNIKHDFTGIL